MKLKAILSGVVIIVSSSLSITHAQQSQSISFQPNNVLVVRVGDGNSGLTDKASAVFLDEYTTLGKLVQSVPMPTSKKGSNASFVLSGNNRSQGYSSLSANGKYVTLMGYDAALGTEAKALKAPESSKVIAVISKDKLETKVTEPVDIIDPRSVVTTNGKEFWFIGLKGGVRYFNVKNSKSDRVTYGSLSAGRILNIFDNQLYVSTADPDAGGYLTKVGVGLPIDITKVSAVVPRVPDINFLVHGYVLFDVNPAVPGVDLLYVNGDMGTGYLRKYTFDGTSWNEVGTPSTGAMFKNGALTGSLENGLPVLYATNDNKVIKITDNASASEKLDVKAEILFSAPRGTVFKGITFTPETKLVFTKK